MRLKTVRVTNFRCILDTTAFEIDAVTCLVGKNESGKTSILHALRGLKDYQNPKTIYDKERDFPRAYQYDAGDEPDRVLLTTWDLSEEDVAAVEAELGKGTVTKKSISVSKYYDSASARWTVSIDQKKVIALLASLSKVSAEENKTLKELSTTVEVTALISESGPDASAELKALGGRIGKFRDNDAVLAAIDMLAPRLPHFLYFGSYDQMSGNVALIELQNQVASDSITPENKVFLAFLDFAGIPLEQIPKLQNFESMMARLERASNLITDQVFEYWSQNQFLRATFGEYMGMPGDPPPFNAGWNLRTRIYNELHKATVDFDNRSTGFVWFFSFLALFSQVRKTHGNVIILLDEPGLSLHGRAQGDLQRYINEKLRPEHQVIYTTHSPFMVPANNLTSVRIVEDVVEMQAGKKPIAHGTKVSSDVMVTDQDSVFPLQGALGYEITQTLFVGKHTLLVEGPSDVLMLQSSSAKLKSLRREGLDPRWTLCPVGGIGKVMPFVNLFGGANKLDVAVLADYQQKDKQELERLKEIEILKLGRIQTAETFCGQEEADTEDFFGATLYASMVNGAFVLNGKNAISADAIAKVAEKTPRIVKRVEVLFRTMPPEVPEFDHYQAAYWLQQHPELWDVDAAESEKALARFESFFKVINALLPKQE